MKITIAGAGIIGLCCAYYLRKSGHEVQVLDRGNYAGNCSFGNAGLIVPSHVIPLAAPGVIGQGIKWMFNKRSPFSIKPRISLDLLAWSWRFYRASTSQKVNQAMPVLRDISFLSKNLYSDLISEIQADCDFEKRGLLMLYKTTKMEHEELKTMQLAQSIGLDARKVTPMDLQGLDPGVVYDVLGGVYYPGDEHFNPAKVMTGLRSYLMNNGVKFVNNFNIDDAAIRNGKIAALKSGKNEIEVEYLVAALGSWSPKILKKMDLKLRIQDGKGYSTTITKPKGSPTIPAILLEARAAITPMGQHLRIGGSMELTGMDNRINMHKVSAIMEAFKNYYPGLDPGPVKKEDVWYGYRPCSFDGLPYIGDVKSITNLVVATGHSMMGISLGPATGKLVSELINKDEPSLDMQPFDPQR
jgi:D-amino-acid dehydrogenase